MTPSLLTTAARQLVGMSALIDLRPLAAPVQLRGMQPRISIRERERTTTQPTTMMSAVEGSTTLDASEIAAVIVPVRRAVDALRTGAASFDDWLRLASVVNIANAIERQGVVRGMASELAKCEAAVQAIGDRTGDTHDTWKSPTLYAAEIVATSDLVHWHKFQLQQLSYKEYDTARNYAVAKVRSSGGRAFNAKGLKP